MTAKTKTNKEDIMKSHIKNYTFSSEDLVRLAETTDRDLKKLFPDIPREVLREKKKEARSLIERQSPEDLIEKDRTVSTLKRKTKVTDQKYNTLLKQYEDLQSKFEIVTGVKNADEQIIIRDVGKHTKSEAVAVALLSDWHVDEVIKSAMVNGANEFNLVEAERRAKKCFVNLVKMLQKEASYSKIDTIVVALLGDFFSGNIHEELMESNSLLPIEAVMKAQKLLMAGIQYILDNTELNVIVQCHSGNHARITGHQRRISTEHGNSLEFYMYHMMSDHFSDSDRVTFNISLGYHSYLDIFDTKIRFHHGHWMRYGGGVGGIYIPVNKAIAQWNKIIKADLDCFGHWHQLRDGGNFICNGSLIGYNSFALSIKADYESPKQAFFVLDKKRGKTITAPIFMT